MKQTTLKRKTPLKARKRLNPISDKQRERNALWGNITNLKSKVLNYICQWCGLHMNRADWFNPIDGHHIIKRRYRNDTYDNCYVCHRLCHTEIENSNIDVRVYPNKKSWEREVKDERKV